MKTLLQNSNKLLKYAFTVIAFALVIGLVFIIGFGFNGSADFGKTYELTVDCFDESAVNTTKEKMVEVIKANGYSELESFVEDRSYCDTVVVRYKSNSTIKAQEIKAQTIEKLGLNENLVSISKLSHSTATKASIKLIIGVSISAVLLFLLGLIRYDIKYALALFATFVLSIMLPLAVIAITRIELSTSIIAIIASIASLASFIFAFSYAKMQMIKKYQEKEESYQTNYINYINENKFKAIIPSALVLVMVVAFMFIFNRSLIFIGLSILLSTLIAGFISLVLSPAILISLDKDRK